MYTKEEKKTIKVEFWTSFGVYMRKYVKRYGNVHWVNYKTKIKDMYFRLEFTEQEAVFSIDLQHKDDGIRELFYEQLTELKVVLQDAVGQELKWEELCFNEFDQPVSRISASLPGVNLFNKQDWPKVFDFFETRMVGLHQFWMEFKDIFIELQN